MNGDYRLMDSSELVYILTNSAVMVNKVQEKEVVYGEECSFEDVLARGLQTMESETVFPSYF